MSIWEQGGNNVSELLESLVIKHGSDFLDPEKCLNIYQELIKQKKFLTAELTITNSDSNIGRDLAKVENALNNSKLSIADSSTLIENVEENLNEIDFARKQFEVLLSKLNCLQSTLQYLKVIQKVEYYNVQLEREYKKKDDEQCATAFANLSDINQNLLGFPGIHLKNHLKLTLLHWNKILKEKYSRDFESILKTIKWPFVNSNSIAQQNADNTMTKFQLVCEYLLQIELPSESDLVDGDLSLAVSFPKVCLPVALLVQPLKKRFLYHFYGPRQTNRSDKPEWYFTQILTWIRDHRDFVEKWIQPVLDRLGMVYVNSQLEFTRELVRLAVEKLHFELPSAQFDDITFSHCVDEALGFDKELRESYNYPSTQPSVYLVLTQAQLFMKWITMERKFALEKMDLILSSTVQEPFEALASDIEDLKITVCGDAFVTLLQTITDRYESLPQPGHRIQFLELQLDLLDDFRIRLLQIVNAEEGELLESKIPMVANTLFYIENTLNDWANVLHYLSLFYYKNQLKFSEEKERNDQEWEVDTVFAETISLYSHMRLDLLDTLAQAVINEVKAKSRSYRIDRWSSMKNRKNFSNLSLTPTACTMFESIAKWLHQLEKFLTTELFATVWRSVSEHLDTYLFENLVMENRFTEDAALQFKYDIRRNLLPLFSQFSERPEKYFTKLIESINLLNLSKGSALLLKDHMVSLEGATGVEDTRGRALKEIGVENFTPYMALQILNRRTDITIDRLEID